MKKKAKKKITTVQERRAATVIMKRQLRASSLTLHELREKNVARCNKHFHSLEEWSPSDWACALAGEVGEFCNFIKKLRRGEKIPLKKLAKEAGDIQCYLDLATARLGIDLAEAVIDKFNEVSRRRKSKIRL